MFIIRYRRIFFILSAVLVAASILAIAIFGIRLGIDFTGGTLIEISYTQLPDRIAVENRVKTLPIGAFSIRQEGDSGYIVRTRSINEAEKQALLTALSPDESGAQLVRLANVGPVIGQELKSKALTAIVLVILAIVFYIAFVFRKVSKPVSSWVYGIAAVLGLIHDVLLPLGVFAWLGWAFGVEIDSLFVAALLTILGFSVHDTIVVFDRIRENLKHNLGSHTQEPFEMTVGKSLGQTYVRSINTSLTVVIVLLTLFFFGSTATEDFTLALLVGIVAGTYSSICLASLLLVVWERWRRKEAK